MKSYRENLTTLFWGAIYTKVSVTCSSEFLTGKVGSQHPLKHGKLSCVLCYDSNMSFWRQTGKERLRFKMMCLCIKADKECIVLARSVK